MSAPLLFSIPNSLSLSRIPLAVILFSCIHYHLWLAGLIVFLLAAFTDWLDGFLARRWKQTSFIGRALDPLTDKLLVCGAFIYLLPFGPEPADTGLSPWMVTVVIGREILITGIRGIVETAGISFGADWFGKLKTVLQMTVIIGALIVQLSHQWNGPTYILWPVFICLLWAMLVSTVGSGLQYIYKAGKVLSELHVTKQMSSARPDKKAPPESGS